MGNEVKGRDNKSLELQGWLVRILRHMFKEVGQVFWEEDVQKDGWFDRYSWSEYMCGEFRAWMRKTLKKQHPWKYMREGLLNKELDYFIKNYAWRVQ